MTAPSPSGANGGSRRAGAAPSAASRASPAGAVDAR